MAVNTITVAEVILRAKRRADMENSAFVSDAEVLDLFNEAYTELYDLMVEANENYFVSSTTINVVSGTDTYTLPTDFYKVIGVDFQLSASGSNDYITLKPFTEAERNGSIGSTNALPSGVVRVRYVPQPNEFTATTDTVTNIISGWESLLVADMAIMMLEKEESDTTAIERRRERTYKRIRSMKQNRDLGMPARVSDIYSVEVLRQYAAMRYRLYGTDIVFLSTEIVSPESYGTIL